MSNMSYCRFQNTAGDLDDCQEALENLLHGEPGNERDGVALSRDEERAAKRLLMTALALVELVAETQARKIEELDGSDIDDFIDQAQEAAREFEQKSEEEANSE